MAGGPSTSRALHPARPSSTVLLNSRQVADGVGESPGTELRGEGTIVPAPRLASLGQPVGRTEASPGCQKGCLLCPLWSKDAGRCQAPGGRIQTLALLQRVRSTHVTHCVPMPVSSQTASLLGFSLTSYPRPSTQDPGGDVRSIFPSSSLPPACPRPPRCCLGKHGRAFSPSAAGTDPGLRKMASWEPPSRVTASPPSTAAVEAGRLLKPGAVDMATSRQSSIADNGKLVCCGSPGSWSAHPEFAP